MKSFWQAIVRFFQRPRNAFWFGFVIACAATGIEVARDRGENFYDFFYSTCLFWGNADAAHAYPDAVQLILQGITPYMQPFRDLAHVNRFFLYSPVFSFLFTPFIWLPYKVAAFAWNLMNYSLFFLAIMKLPKKLGAPSVKVFLYMLLLLEASIFPFQYNIVVSYIFLFAYKFLEEDKPAWAVLLIMLSATTKLYGAIELIMLLCYRRPLRNFGLALLFGVMFLLLPIIHLGTEGFVPYYQSWLAAIGLHNATEMYYSLIYIKPFTEWTMEYRKVLQIGSAALLTLLFFLYHRRWSDFRFRTRVIAVLMGWICLFSDATEPHTYIIACSGYMLFYYSQQQHNRLDEVLYWVNWVLFGIFPIDILCPPVVYDLMHHTLWLDIWLFFFTWLYMIRVTLTDRTEESVPVNAH